MTSDFQHEQVFEIIGLERTKKDMVVFGALLKAQKAPNDFIDFQTIREQLALDEGSRKGKDPLIYRSLSALEKEGFVKIDKDGHKHGYSSSISIIEKALDKLISKSIRTLEKELKQVESDVDIFSNMNSDSLAAGVIDLAAGEKKVEKPDFAQGWENVLKLLDDKVYRGLKKGAVIRITLEWLSHHDFMDPKRLKGVDSRMLKGIEFRSIDHNRGEKKIRDKYRKTISEMRSRGGTVGYRVFPRKDSTYQFIARNNEGIILVVSESPLSATWIPRSANPELVDNAIDAFDRDYEMGTDILEFEG